MSPFFCRHVVSTCTYAVDRSIICVLNISKSTKKKLQLICALILNRPVLIRSSLSWG
uniref:Uncharacterized protein n=1 Tax=Anguilla anguilla TaxID=7936 RepID=A0A0E9XWB7_ANGAN